MLLFFVKKYKVLFILSVLLTGSLYAFQSQNPYLDAPIEQRNFDEKKWKDITHDIDYSEDLGDALEKRKNKKRQPATTPSESWSGPSEGVLTLIKFLLILGGIVGVAVILGYVIGRLKNTPNNKKISMASVKTLDLEQVEENIHETNLEELIQKAVGERQYSIAIRLYYLLIIKELSINEHIQWKKDKTNHDYLLTLKNTPFFVPFRQVTGIYEKAWYGEIVPTKEDFEGVKGNFEALIGQIRLT